MSNTPTYAFSLNCQQRSLYIALESGVNKIRYTPISPYPKYTKQQLDMRRKCEVLQFTNQSYKKTKKQTWAQLVNQSYSAMKSCPNNLLVPSLTSSCDVPGPIIELVYDPKIPLYMYAPIQNVNNQSAYINADTIKHDWDVFPVNDVVLYNTGAYEPILNIVIMQPKYNAYQYDLSFPISVYLGGTRIVAVPPTASVAKISVDVVSAAIDVYYSSLLVVSVPINITNIQGLSVEVDTTIGLFSASKYLGNLLATIPSLPTVPQYVYTFKLNITTNTTFYDSTNTIISTTSNVVINAVNTIANITGPSDPYYNSMQNCSIVDRSIVDRAFSVTPFSAFSLQGVPNGSQSLC